MLKYSKIFSEKTMIQLNIFRNESNVLLYLKF